MPLQSTHTKSSFLNTPVVSCGVRKVRTATHDAIPSKMKKPTAQHTLANSSFLCVNAHISPAFPVPFEAVVTGCSELFSPYTRIITIAGAMASPRIDAATTALLIPRPMKTAIVHHTNNEKSNRAHEISDAQPSDNNDRNTKHRRYTLHCTNL